jgi:large repetitive protein
LVRRCKTTQSTGVPCARSTLRLLRLFAVFVSSRFACLALALSTVAAMAASNVVGYTRDAAGNITAISRMSAPGFAITGFSPMSGKEGAVVTIYGTGFSATPQDNVVKFNGATASVSASAAGSISTTVPAGATTGRITVTLGASTATSPQDFTVIPPTSPTITSFTPTAGVAGTSITITGTYFDTAPNGTTAELNGVSGSVTVTSTTSLTFTIPGAAASGGITATTADGTGASSTDFIVPPTGVAAADIITAVRLAMGGAASSLVIGTASKHGLLLFDGAANGYYTLQFGSFSTSPSNAL